jgi:predicted  nucleic acid-binding Zn-ribbon protein
MITRKSEAEDYVSELLLKLDKLKKQYVELGKEIVDVEDEIEKFTYEFKISDEEMEVLRG